MQIENDKTNTLEHNYDYNRWFVIQSVLSVELDVPDASPYIGIPLHVLQM